MSLKRSIKRWSRRVLPLALRKRIAIWLDRQGWLRSGRWWAVELVQDLAERDPAGYHRFLWSNHLGYADTYEAATRFGAENIHPTRRMLFDDLEHWLRDQEIDPRRDVDSVFEVGCSLGYLLHHAEQGLFRGASRLEGIDLDAQAVREGRRRLAMLHSGVRLHTGDMSDLESLLDGRRYDVFLCCGVLMYVPQVEAERIVAAMLHHAARVVVLAGLAHPTVDNASLEVSQRRRRDGSFVHNLDRMVRRAGGQVAYRRWEGGRIVNGNTIYFVFALPPGRVAEA